MDDKARARRIIECVYIFRKGCSNAGPQAYAVEIGPVDPTECPECLEAFLRQVRYAMEDRKPTGELSE